MTVAPVKILVVDDEQEVLMRISVILSNPDYIVYQATSRQECLLSIENNRPDIVIMDDQLPDGNGIDICREIKSDPDTSSIYVILCYATKESASQVFSQSDNIADDYFTKTAEIWEILSSIRSFSKIKEIKNKLLKSQQQYTSLLTYHPDAVCSIDLDGNFTSANAATTKLTGYSKEELLSMSFIPLIAPDHLSQNIEYFKKALKGDINFYNAAIIHKNGHRIEINITGIPIVVNEKITGIYSVCKDITHSIRLKKIAKAENKVLELALTRSSLEETLTFLLKSIEDISSGMMSSVMLLEEDGQTLRNGSAPSLPKDYTNYIDSLKIGPDIGSCGTAAYLKERVFVSDIAHDKRWMNYKDMALIYGLKACFSFPILSSNKEVLGVFGCYYKQVHLPDQNDIQLIERGVNIAAMLIEREKSQKQIKSKDEQLQEISNFLPGALFQFQLKEDGTVSFPYFSQTIKALYGYSPQELYKNPHLILKQIHPEDTASFFHSIQVSAKAMQPWLLDFRVNKPDKAITWVRGNSIPKKQPDGSIIWYGIITDITDIKRTEETLRMLSRAVESAAEGILITDAGLEDNPVIFANEKFFQNTGYSREEVMGRNCRFLQGKDTDRNTVDKIRETLAEQKPFVGEIFNYKKDGTPFWNLLVIAPVLTTEGKASHYVGLVNDISEQKNNENRLKEQNEQLRKINQELDRFVYSVSHDLRAPLTSVLGLIRLTIENSLSRDTKEYLHLMEESVLKLDRTIKDILDYSRNSRTEIVYKRINLHELIDEVFAGVEFLEGANQLTKHIEIDETTPWYSDRSRLLIILSNIISNSIKYRNPYIANPFIDIRVDVKIDKVSIVVKDNGIGIAEKHINKIFDMFFRATKQSSGTGLGLYIVKEAVAKLGGSIEVNSKVNEGTVFTILIPNHLQAV